MGKEPFERSRIMAVAISPEQPLPFFTAQQSVMADMEAKAETVMFYYYNDSVDKDDELGLVFWSGDNSYSVADTYADWYVWVVVCFCSVTALAGTYDSFCLRLCILKCFPGSFRVRILTICLNGCTLSNLRQTVQMSGITDVMI